ncbi:uncharacterized protein BBOV_IV006280 [Babesia bovis T2Bo]|uniref:U3 small nucleolar RNA-associated protein 20 domain-containing protein n=1 Tax=Babesia bovis TaxID=5865 RepID=A7AR18_BABBO|nr:uncharacterized protein BBOV_IV006280 [Babesia bovis T2Bo]EDO06987.1 hypothetical protein BBOV_IV006280 [Babesia bovis T2Bo]|eukprot:XP_001610555.1 hypothetical protein [Babesia bovis T2Bo]
MTNRGKFKFQSASKRSRSLKASSFSDISTVAQPEVPIENRRSFLHNVRITLRSKELITYNQELKGILDNCGVLTEGKFATSWPFPKWSEYAIQTLLRCAQAASTRELTPICRLLAFFFKDYGDQICVNMPFGDLLNILENSPENNSEPIFSLLATHFRANSRCVSEDLDDLIALFTPWLRHSNQLIRRMSMESLSLLLRRIPDKRMDNSEHLLFGIIKNVNGTFTTKLHPLFKHLLCTLPTLDICHGNGVSLLDARSRIAAGFRECLMMMKKHCKSAKMDIAWLHTSYEEFIAKFNDDSLSPDAIASYSISAELSIELFLLFGNNHNVKIKDMVLVRSPTSFDAFLTFFVIPLLRFAKCLGPQGDGLFCEICQLLVRVVRSDTECTNVLRDRFTEVLDDLLHFMTYATNINPLMVLFEWRLRSDDLVHISHFLLVISHMFEENDLFHPVIINPVVRKRIMECVDASVNNILALQNDAGVPTEEYDSQYSHHMSIIFGCLTGIRCIHALSSRMKSVNSAINVDTLESILRECLSKITSDPDILTVRVYMLCIDLLEPSRTKEWADALVDATVSNKRLQQDYSIIDYLSKNFNENVTPLANLLMALLPHPGTKFRISCLKFLKAFFDSSGLDTNCLTYLLEMEAFEPSLENERKKSLLISKVVDTMIIPKVLTEKLNMYIELIFKILASQFFVKFAPLWQAAFENIDKLVSKLTSNLTGKQSSNLALILDHMWDSCFKILEATEDSSPKLPNGLPHYMLPFIRVEDDQSTDAVTIQREVLRVITTLISHMDHKDQRLMTICSYAYAQMTDTSKDRFRRNALEMVSMLLQQYKMKDPPSYLVDACLRDGVRSSDGSTRESSLLIVAMRFPGINIKRLHSLAIGEYQDIMQDQESGGTISKDPRMRELSRGIEIRMLCPRILQHSKQPHFKNIFEYISSLDSRYVSMICAEFLPGCFSNHFFTASVTGDDAFTWMVDVMGFNGGCYSNFPTQKSLRALGVMVQRLKKTLHTQALPLFECCLKMLADCTNIRNGHEDVAAGYMADCNVDSMVSIITSLMIDLITYFQDLMQQFISLLSGYSSYIESLLNGNQDVLSLVECLLRCNGYTKELCTSIIPGAFPRIFQYPGNATLFAIIEHLYCQYDSSDEDSPMGPMKQFLVAHSPAVLDALRSQTPIGVHISHAILMLPIPVEHRRSCLTILMQNIPHLKRAYIQKSTDIKQNHEYIGSLRLFLECLNLCVGLLTSEDEEMVQAMWDIVNDYLFYVGDLQCRRLACSLLSSIPTQDTALAALCDHLIIMNGSDSNSMDAKMDLDINCERMPLLISDVVEQGGSARVIFTALTHALYLMVVGHKDPSVRRSVLNLTNAVMASTSKVLMNFPLDKDTQSSCEALDSIRNPYLDLISKCIFPFIKHCISNEDGKQALFFSAIELIEQFSSCYSCDQRLAAFFGEKLHGDLLFNQEVLQCFKQLHHVQKHWRNEGLKQLALLIERQGLFTSHTTYKLLVPICLEFLLQSRSSKYSIYREPSIDCLVASGAKLPPDVLLTFLHRLLELYESDVEDGLHVFSRIIVNLPLPTNEKPSVLVSQEPGDDAKYRWLLQRLRQMLTRTEDGAEIPCPSTYGAFGSLLRHQNADSCAKEVVKLSRLLCKSLCTRTHDIRQAGRQALIKFLQCIGFEYFPVVLKELAGHMSRGYQLQVLLYTCHAILSTFSMANPGFEITHDKVVTTLCDLITNVLILEREKEGVLSKMTETKESKASGIVRLLSEFGSFDVCLSTIRYLWSIVKGTCTMPPDMRFEYSVNHLQVVERLLSSSVTGLLANKNVDLYALASVVFYAFLPLVRGMKRRFKAQLPSEAQSQYAQFSELATASLKLHSVNSNNGSSSKEPQKNSFMLTNKAKEELYTLYPGTSTGRSLASSTKLGFDDHIVSPLFVDVALKIYAKLAVDVQSEFETRIPDDVEPNGELGLSLAKVSWMTTALGIVLCFISEDMKLQKSAAAPLIHLCNDNTEFMNICGPILAEHLVESMGSMHLIGSDDIVKDHITLVSHFLRSNQRDILFAAWEKMGKSKELVPGILMQLEANLDRVGLQPAILKLFTLLLQLEMTHDNIEKTLYQVFQEILVRMLKGGMTPSAMRASSEAIAMFLICVPMEESNRSKRFGMLLKHVTSSIPLVRLTVLQCLRHFLRGLCRKAGWKRYSEMVMVCVTMQLLNESDLQCKRVMARIIAFIWSESPPDIKKGLMECITHFLTKTDGCKEVAFAYFSFHCLSTENSLAWVRKSCIFDFAVGFTPTLESELSVLPNSVLWQFPYYWLRLLDQFLNLPQSRDSLTINEILYPGTDSLVVVMNRVWQFALDHGIGSSHPWIRAASLRMLTRLVSSAEGYANIYQKYDGEIYLLIRPGLKLLSIETAMIERHDKVGVALEQCVTSLMDQILANISEAEKNLERLINKLCHDLRLCLGNYTHCKRRIDILLKLLHHYVKNDKAYDTHLRAPMLRIMIASSRALTCNIHLHRISEYVDDDEAQQNRTSLVSEHAHQIICDIESRFSMMDKANEYTKLLSFARDFVSRRKMMQRLKRQSNSRPKTKKTHRKKKKKHNLV